MKLTHLFNTDLFMIKVLQFIGWPVISGVLLALVLAQYQQMQQVRQLLEER
jgi:hypothetical protein